MDVAPGTAVVETLIAAVNRHDLEGIVETFATNVRSDTPAHPARSFVGGDQVRRNWTGILGSIRDLEARILASTTEPGLTPGSTTVWAEIAFDGRRPDGAPWRMRGVTVNEVVGERITSLRFYLEPVEEAGPDANATVRSLIGSSGAAATRTSTPTSNAAAIR